MGKRIPEAFKKSRFFKENPEEIKFNPNSYNEIYFTIEQDKDDETLVVHYQRNYEQQPEQVRISYDDLTKNYPTVELLIDQFINLIIFGISGTFIKKGVPLNGDLQTCEPRVKLQKKIQKLMQQPQLSFALATHHRNDKNINTLFQKLFPIEKIQRKVKDIFKGFQNNTAEIDPERIIAHFKKNCEVLGVRNILIINNPVDIPNPKSLGHCVVIPDPENKFLTNIDAFVDATTINATPRLNLHCSFDSDSPAKDNFSKEKKTPSKDEFQPKEKNKWLNYSPESETENSPQPASEKTENKKRNSDAHLISEKWTERAKKSKKDKSEEIHEKQSFQRTLSEEWTTPRK